MFVYIKLGSIYSISSWDIFCSKWLLPPTVSCYFIIMHVAFITSTLLLQCHCFCFTLAVLGWGGGAMESLLPLFPVVDSEIKIDPGQPRRWDSLFVREHGAHITPAQRVAESTTIRSWP